MYMKKGMSKNSYSLSDIPSCDFKLRINIVTAMPVLATELSFLKCFYIYETVKNALKNFYKQVILPVPPGNGRNRRFHCVCRLTLFCQQAGWKR